MGRVPEHPVELSLEDDERAERLAATLVMISLHEHVGLFPARIEETPGYTAIRRDDTHRAVTITANVDDEKITGIEANKKIQELWPSIAARYIGRWLCVRSPSRQASPALPKSGR